jgi:thioredoxin 2
MSDIAKCTHCGTKNRLATPPKGQVPVCGKCKADLPWLVKATDSSFQADLNASVPVLVDFWAPWCGPCRMISPVLEELAKDLAGKLKIVKLNVDDNPATAQVFNARSIPMLIVFKNAEPVDTFLGAMPKGALLQKLQPHLS